MIKKLIKLGSKYIDYKSGLVGAFFMGAFVFIINYNLTHLLYGSITASIKQAFYTFLLGGFFLRSCERIAIAIKRKYLAIILSSVIPTVFTLIITFGLHTLKGTPKPFESTLPTTLIFPATLVWGYKKRKKHFSKINEVNIPAT